MDNIVEKQLERLRVRLQDVYEGRIPLLFVVSPNSVGVSGVIRDAAAEYDRQEQERWLATPRQERRERRTHMLEDGRDEFFPPTMFVSGRLAAPSFHCRMYWASYRGEVLIMDDAASLSDPQIVTAIQQATDLAHMRMVAWESNPKSLPDDRVPVRYPMRGGIVITAKSRDAIPHVLQDRALTLLLTDDQEATLQYVLANAFDTNTKRGLYAYLTNPPADEFDWREGGLGLERADANDVFAEVKDFVMNDLVPRFGPKISFRVLRRVVQDRVNHPEQWKALATHMLGG